MYITLIFRERENYENYSIYYESLLRHHHHLLYVKELEMKAAESQQGSGFADDSVKAQVQLLALSFYLQLRPILIALGHKKFW